MNGEDLTIPDVLEDQNKDFCKIYNDTNNEQDEECKLTDSQYYTESDFINLIETHNISHEHHLTLITINIANLLSKLNNFKVFLKNISNKENKPDYLGS